MSAGFLQNVTPDAKLILLYREPIARAWSGYRFESQIKGNSAGETTFLERHSAAVKALNNTELEKARSIGADAVRRGPGSAWGLQGCFGLRGFGPISPNHVKSVFASASVTSSHYAKIYEEFSARFGSDKLLLVSFEELCQNTEGVLRRIFRFIGVDDQVPLPDLGKSMPEDMDMIQIDKSATRKSAEVSEEDRAILAAYYEPHNQRFAKILGRPIDDLWGFDAREK